MQKKKPIKREKDTIRHMKQKGKREILRRYNPKKGKAEGKKKK